MFKNSARLFSTPTTPTSLFSPPLKSDVPNIPNSPTPSCVSDLTADETLTDSQKRKRRRELVMAAEQLLQHDGKKIQAALAMLGCESSGKTFLLNLLATINFHTDSSTGTRKVCIFQFEHGERTFVKIGNNPEIVKGDDETEFNEAVKKASKEAQDVEMDGKILIDYDDRLYITIQSPALPFEGIIIVDFPGCKDFSTDDYYVKYKGERVVENIQATIVDAYVEYACTPGVKAIIMNRLDVLDNLLCQKTFADPKILAQIRNKNKSFEIITALSKWGKPGLIKNNWPEGSYPEELFESMLHLARNEDALLPPTQAIFAVPAGKDEIPCQTAAMNSWLTAKGKTVLQLDTLRILIQKWSDEIVQDVAKSLINDLKNEQHRLRLEKNRIAKNRSQVENFEVHLKDCKITTLGGIQHGYYAEEVDKCIENLRKSPLEVFMFFLNLDNLPVLNQSGLKPCDFQMDQAVQNGIHPNLRIYSWESFRKTILQTISASDNRDEKIKVLARCVTDFALQYDVKKLVIQPLAIKFEQLLKEFLEDSQQIHPWLTADAISKLVDFISFQNRLMLDDILKSLSGQIWTQFPIVEAPALSLAKRHNDIENAISKEFFPGILNTNHFFFGQLIIALDTAKKELAKSKSGMASLAKAAVELVSDVKNIPETAVQCAMDPAKLKQKMENVTKITNKIRGIDDRPDEIKHIDSVHNIATRFEKGKKNIVDYFANPKEDYYRDQAYYEQQGFLYAYISLGMFLEGIISTILETKTPIVVEIPDELILQMKEDLESSFAGNIASNAEQLARISDCLNGLIESINA
ncbi:hypothetical protein BC833DRAFT_596455 [Globomyces pollinis-pini]|nr:hypothetical protein BC833DRAFT_596455 [Globomyces pollinis-pini]